MIKKCKLIIKYKIIKLFVFFSISKLRQDLSEKILENSKFDEKSKLLEEKITELQNKIDAKKIQMADLEIVIDQQNRTIDVILSAGNEAQVF